MIKIIAAVGKRNELGKDNALIWHLPGDLKFFKQQTAGNVVAMGRNTFNSLPKKLPNRHHIVLTDTYEFNKDTEGVQVFLNANDFVRQCMLQAKTQDVYIIGGASIYKMFIDIADELYLTEIDAEALADVYFPEFDKNAFDKEIIGAGEDGGINYRFIRYFNRKQDTIK